MKWTLSCGKDEGSDVVVCAGVGAVAVMLPVPAGVCDAGWDGCGAAGVVVPPEHAARASSTAISSMTSSLEGHS